LVGSEFNLDDSFEQSATADGRLELQRQASRPVTKPSLPIFSVLDSIDFSDHFVIVGDVGTGKSTVTPIHEFERSQKSRRIVIREPSRASCNALFYSLGALHPEVKDEMAIITKDTKINVGGKIRIVTDGVLLRMLAEDSINDSSIYFDESHQMSS
jgi:HrpA-like RNA helicase